MCQPTRVGQEIYDLSPQRQQAEDNHECGNRFEHVRNAVLHGDDHMAPFPNENSFARTALPHLPSRYFSNAPHPSLPALCHIAELSTVCAETSPIVVNQNICPPRAASVPCFQCASRFGLVVTVSTRKLRVP